MPLTLASLISRRANRFPSRSSTRPKQNLYFPPGGHTHDRHSIPPDRLLVSFSDPVLVAAEETLARTPPNHRNGRTAIKTPKDTASPGPTLLHHVLSQRSDDDDDSPFHTSFRHSLITKLQGDTQQADDSCDITEVMTIVIDGSPGNITASENSRDGSDLAPLASAVFKEELYARGYLKRPSSRPANVVLRTPKNNFMLMSRKVFPKVLGRFQGRQVAACLRAEQDADINPGGPNAILSESPLSTVTSITPRAPHTDRLECSGMDTNTSASESFDLHEFSYITAFTTPPSSPSITLDVKTFKKGVCLGDGKHAI